LSWLTVFIIYGLQNDCYFSLLRLIRKTSVNHPMEILLFNFVSGCLIVWYTGVITYDVLKFYFIYIHRLFCFIQGTCILVLVDYGPLSRNVTDVLRLRFRDNRRTITSVDISTLNISRFFMYRCWILLITWVMDHVL
jgi:hypothetical protein